MKQKLPIEAIVPGGRLYNDFQPQHMKQLCCEGCITSYFFNNEFHLFHTEKGEWENIANHSLSALKKLLGDKFSDTCTLHPIKDKGGIFWLKLNKEIVIADLLHLTTIRHIAVKDDWEAFDYNAKADCFAFTSQNGLYLLYANGETEQVYKSENKAVEAGKAAARNEFGIEKGTFWNNSGTQLAFFITDQTNVTTYPLVDVSTPVATCRNIYYPMAGQTSEQTKVGIYNLTQKKVTMVEKNGKNEDYCCCITFTPDDHYLLVAELNRRQTNCTLSKFDAITGRYVSTLLTDTDEKYIEPEHTPLFIDNNRFVWQIRRSNYDLPYLYDLDGNYLGLLANQDADVTRIVGWDDTSQLLVMETNAGSYTGRQLLGADLKGNTVDITEYGEKSTHKATLLENGLLIDEEDSPTTAYKAVLRRLDSKKTEGLIESPSPLAEYAVPEIEMGTVELNGYDICYRLVKPVGLDPKRKYPLVCYVYGGPHVQLIRSDWNNGTAGFEYLMATNGYYVFSIDPRGSAYRGKKFEQEIWRHIGQKQLEDYKTSTKWITTKEPNIDAERIGVYGWSFGGFMATSLMLKTEGMFKVGVAGGPVTDWKLYEVMYTERYMQTPEENPDGFEENNLCNHIGELKGKLMLIHCDNDPVVLWQNSLCFLKQAVKQSRQVDYGVYVGHPHNVRGPERIHLMEKVKQYFDKNL